ncbi:hypothetical protein YC2023_055732 [Brassica napus]
MVHYSPTKACILFLYFITHLNINETKDYTKVLKFTIKVVSEPIAETLRRTPQHLSSKVSTKGLLFSLLPNPSSPHEQDSLASIKNLALACALLSSSLSSTHELFSWIPESLSLIGFSEISRDYYNGGKMRLVIELLPVVLPELKDTIEGSSMGKKSDDAEDVSAALTRQPVGYAVLAAHQLKWFVTQWMHSDDAETVLLKQEKERVGERGGKKLARPPGGSDLKSPVSFAGRGNAQGENSVYVLAVSSLRCES